MNRRRVCLSAGLALGLLIGGLVLLRAQARNEDLDPVKLTPDRTKLILENTFVRVTEERVPPGQGLPRHSHLRGVIVALSDYDSEQKVYPAGQVVRAHRRVGEVNWVETTVHETRNVGSTLQNVIRIELK